MKPITQEDKLGCGIACVAFVSKLSYNYAKKNYFSKPHQASTLGYLCKDLVKALSKAGKDYQYNYLKSRVMYKENSIIFIKRSKKYPVGHYLVKTKNGWMDSWINFNKLNKNLSEAKSGFKKRLPGKAIYIIFPKT